MLDELSKLVRSFEHVISLPRSSSRDVEEILPQNVKILNDKASNLQSLIKSMSSGNVLDLSKFSFNVVDGSSRCIRCSIAIIYLSAVAIYNKIGIFHYPSEYDLYNKPRLDTPFLQLELLDLYLKELKMSFLILLLQLNHLLVFIMMRIIMKMMLVMNLEQDLKLEFLEN